MNFALEEDLEYFSNQVNTEGLYEYALGLFTLSSQGIIGTSTVDDVDAITGATQTEWTRVGLISSWDDAAVYQQYEDTVAWLLYKDIEDYVYKAPWEWTEYAIDYQFSYNIAHALFWGQWGDNNIDEILGYSAEGFDWYTFSQSLYSTIVYNCAFIDGTDEVDIISSEGNREDILLGIVSDLGMQNSLDFVLTLGEYLDMNVIYEYAGFFKVVGSTYSSGGLATLVGETDIAPIFAEILSIVYNFSEGETALWDSVVDFDALFD